MATEMHRFTITISDDMEAALDEIKQQTFYKDSQSAMIRELLALGIEAQKKKNAPAEA